jgi:hypothetical protein
MGVIEAMGGGGVCRACAMNSRVNSGSDDTCHTRATEANHSVIIVQQSEVHLASAAGRGHCSTS